MWVDLLALTGRTRSTGNNIVQETTGGYRLFLFRSVLFYDDFYGLPM